MTLFEKVSKSNTGDLAIRAVLAIALGGGAGYIGHERKDIDVTNVESSLTNLKADYSEYRTRSRERNEKRDAEVQALKDRILVLETNLIHLERRIHAQE